MLTKDQIREIFAKYDLKPLKRFGENYLIDGNIKDKIIAESHVKKGDVSLEIGPGFGALTIDLAETGADLYAVEKDRKVFTVLKDIVKDQFPNLRLFCGDILEFDLKKAAGDKKVKVIGNLPYYITTPILEYLIENKPLIDYALITVQHEVARRLLTSPGTKDYSSLSCLIQYHTKPHYIYTVKRASFYPIPDVESSIVRLDFLPKPSVSVSDETLFFKIIRGAFNQRRKSIINSLSRVAVLDMPKEKLKKILDDIGIDPNSRPEHLSLHSFATIAKACG